MLCTQIVFCFVLFLNSEQFMYITCSKLVVFMHWTRNSMNNLLWNFGLIDGRISASEKDLPVQEQRPKTTGEWMSVLSKFVFSGQTVPTQV